jgi:hypothetical protein
MKGNPDSERRVARQLKQGYVKLSIVLLGAVDGRSSAKRGPATAFPPFRIFRSGFILIDICGNQQECTAERSAIRRGYV